MKKGLKKPVKVRRKWTLNPRTRVKESDRLYSRPKAKKAIEKIYEIREGEEFEA